MEMTTETKTLVGVLTVTVLIIIAGGFFAGQSSPTTTSQEQVVDSERLVREDDPSFGPTDAAVTIVEFGDFQCPACGSLHLVLELVKEANPDVRFVFRQFPLTRIHEFAQKASEASLAAGAQGKFWEYHDLLFENQSQLTRDDLITHAGTLGLDVSRFTSELDEAVYRSAVSDDQTDGNILGVRGTPTLLINGVQYQDQYSVHGLQAAIDSARGE